MTNIYIYTYIINKYCYNERHIHLYTSNTCTHIYVNTQIHIDSTHTHICKHTNTYRQMKYLHTYIHTHMHIQRQMQKHTYCSDQTYFQSSPFDQLLFFVLTLKMEEKKHLTDIFSQNISVSFQKNEFVTCAIILHLQTLSPLYPFFKI